MKWKLGQLADSPQIRQLAKALSTTLPFPLPLANILSQRGINSFDEAKAFFRPKLSVIHDPFLMKGMDKAVHLVQKAMSRNEKILLIGDYDVDGTSAVSLLSLYFEYRQISFDYYIPDRYKEGYGVSFDAIDFAVANNCSLIITLDCGIKAFDELAYAKAKGLRLIICDHHNPSDLLPEADSILNPKQIDCPYPYKELTGCGVGMKLIQALEVDEQSPFKDRIDPVANFGDLLALSIACDIVPITGENRVFVAIGLEKMKIDPLPGIKAIMDLSQQQREWDVSDLVFFIGPRVNAAGRLGDAKDAVGVLIGRHEQLKFKAVDLDTVNTERKDLDQRMKEEAMIMIAQDQDYQAQHTTVLYHQNWHKGVIGIVASRLIEEYHRPTILLAASEGKLVGSARSVPGFDLYEALHACSDHLLQFGGHKYAAGLTIKEEKLEVFKAHFEQIVRSNITEEQKTPSLDIDHQLSFVEIDDRFLRLVNYMAPFGPGNRRPVWASYGVELLDKRIMKSEHLKLILKQNGKVFEALAFFRASKWGNLPVGSKIDIAYQLGFNTWKGITRINLKIKDIKAQ